MDEKRIKLAIRNGQETTIYEQLINDLIRERYTINQELAIQRQRDVKIEEFNIYNAYIESCKEQVKSIISKLKEEGGI